MTTRKKSPKSTALPVMLRVHGKRTKSPASNADLVAIFPTELGDVRTPNSMVCYCPIGEHSACDSNYAGSRTRPATKEEQERLLKALRNVGYDNLKVVSRPSSHHRAARVKQYRR